MFFIPRQQEIYPDAILRLYPEKFQPYIDVNQNKQITPRVKTITYQVTEDCNMACTYCYQHCKTQHIMTLDKAKQFTDWLLDLNNIYYNPTTSPAVVIEFIGGEPFLAIDLIDQICDYFIACFC